MAIRELSIEAIAAGVEPADAMTAAGRETGGEGESGPARPSSGRVRGRDADLHTDG